MKTKTFSNEKNISIVIGIIYQPAKAHISLKKKQQKNPHFVSLFYRHYQTFQKI